MRALHARHAARNSSRLKELAVTASPNTSRFTPWRSRAGVAAIAAVTSGSALAAFAWSTPSFADVPQSQDASPSSPPPEPSPPQPEASSQGAQVEAAPSRDRMNDDETSVHRPRFGALGGLGFPHPLSIEAMVKLNDYVAVGVEYGVLPTITVDDVDTHLWSLAADSRIFPFRNAFYIGLRAGRQHVGAATTVAVDPVGSLPETLALDSWFLNPRVGVLWTSTSGLTVGTEIGVQIPTSSSVTSSLPLAYAPEAERTVDTLGKTVLPTIQLLQVGFLF
jgi:hypothetical protein